jgi:indolepyruvate ferredoxin oxidoreductase beta subunit
VSSELLETVRQIGNGMASPERTQILTSSARTLTTNERMQLADGRMPIAPLLDAVRRSSRSHHVFDMTGMTQEAGTVVSAVMFGAIAASGALPFPRPLCEETIRAGGKSAQASLAGFALAFERVDRERQQGAFVAQVLDADDGIATALPSAPTRALPDEIRSRFPAETHALLALGHARVLEYQDAAYATLYVERMARVLDAERTADPAERNGFAATTETARWLALWMAFDDIVRVAELKARATRAERVRREVKVRNGELLRVFDHFKPGVPEFAALLPPRIATRLAEWDRRRRARGREPLAFPLKLGTHTATGMLALRFLAGLRGFRRRGARFALEQQLIERWLAAIERGIRDGWTLGHELAQCGRLIKGYGSTNERGKENLLHIVDHLATTDAPAAMRAAAIRAARVAALADEAGTALDRTLVEHGAPPRPAKPVPIRFMRKPVSGATR